MNARSSPTTAVRSLPALAVRLAWQWARPVAALAVASGVVAATIVGALGVGESMRKGLSTLAISRLGGIEAAVISEGLFREQLAEELAVELGSAATAVPAIVMNVVVDRSAGGGQPLLSSRATLLACNEPGVLGFDPSLAPLESTAVAINAPLARALEVAVGDPLVLRIPDRSAAPSDSPLGRRDLASRGRRLILETILPAEGLGRFSLQPTQVTGPLVVVPLATAQAMLGRGAVANVIFAVPGEGWTERTSVEASSLATLVAERLAPDLADYGLTLAQAAGTPAVRLTSERLVLPDEVDRVAERLLAARGGQPSLMFLATSIDSRGGAGSIPYSTIAGVTGAELPVGDLVDAEGRPQAIPAGGMLIDRWMADDLAAQAAPVAVGDLLDVTTFAPETLHGRVEERQHALRVAGIVEMVGAATSRDLVPEVEGVTDEDSIADWDPPFPFQAARVRSTPPDDQDDRYWKSYGATPKAFVRLEDARAIAAGRFGQTTAWHLPASGVDIPALADELSAAIDPTAMGLRVVPLRAEALAAARGSTPFGGLFLALSSFVVMAGLLLLWLLLGLLVTTRQHEVGLLAAIGFTPRRLAMLLTCVGGLAAMAGIAVGAALGPLWTVALLRSLATSWDASVAAGSAAAFGSSLPGLASVLGGGMAALVVAVAAIRWASSRAAARPPLPLLRGLWSAGSPPHGRAVGSRPWATALAVAAIVAAALVAVASHRSGAAAAVGGFFAAGGLTLAGMLGIVRGWLSARRRTIHPQRSLAAVAVGGLRHHASRSFLVVAMLALASFLIIAVSSFTLRLPERLDDRGSPTGGWSMLVSFSRPTGVDPLDPATREQLGLSEQDTALLAGCEIARLRASRGDAADCTNLYAALRPTVLGLPEAWLARGGFRFTAHAALPEGNANPWRLLQQPVPDGTIPAVLDEATAMWALKLGGVGDRFTLPGDDGTPRTFEIVGLLEPGILQGWVLVAEPDFTRAFPDASGYAMAMVGSRGDPREVRELMQRVWADDGVSIEMTADRLRSLYAVQNTFLAGFQALGGLGLLVGTAGIAAVAMQGVFERRHSLSVLRAIGFSSARVRALITVEQVVLVAIGLAVGGGCGMLALWPAIEAGRAVLPLAGMLAVATAMLAAAVTAGLVAVQRAGISERPR